MEILLFITSSCFLIGSLVVLSRMITLYNEMKKETKIIREKLDLILDIFNHKPK